MSFEDIITEIQLKPILWSTSHALYKNRRIKQKGWMELAVKLGIEEDVLKKRWKHLKDQYRKELKKQPVLKSGAESDAWESTWKYFNTMSFMKNEVIHAPSTGNSTINESESTHETENTQSDIDISESVPSPGSYHVQSPAGSSGTSTYNIRKRSNIKDDMLEIEIEQKKLLLMETRLKDSQQDEKLKYDEDFLFLKSILPTMKKLNDLQKLRFRGKINDWLLEACTENERVFNQNQRAQTSLVVKVEPLEYYNEVPEIYVREEAVKVEPSDVELNKQHTRGESSSTAAASSVRLTEELDESSLFGDTEMKAEEIEIHEEGIS